MNEERNNLPIILGLIGLLFIGFAIKFTLEEISGSAFYIFLVIQGVILGYLLYVVVMRGKEAWVEYRWSPDRLK
jgi:hypothetical protein